MQGFRWKDGDNINGPTLIKVPSWVSNPIGKYYLYFGNHKGQYIRMAYSQEPTGPYTLFKGGVFSLPETGYKNTHLASPEIWIDEINQQIRMYFHIAVRGQGIYHDQSQMTFLAISTDGVHFKLHSGPLAPFYLRIFHYRNYFYGIAKNDNLDGIFVRSRDGILLFERGAQFIPGFRHCGLFHQNSLLYVFFTRVNESPESIYLSKVDLTADWMQWQFSEPQKILHPETEWEGAYLPLTVSEYGATKPSNALRDPYFFQDNNQFYLLYSVKGEAGIAIARIEEFP